MKTNRPLLSGGRRLLAAACLGFAAAGASGAADPVSLRLELDRALLPAGQTNRAVLKASILPGHGRHHRDRPPLNLALVIDKSGSMAGDKIEQARQAALLALDLLRPDDVVSLVVYDSEVRTLVPARPLRDRRRFEHAIRGIEAGGNTALYAGVEAGANALAAAELPRGFSRILLLSDGLANVGPSHPADLARLGHRLAARGISISTIGVGLDYHEDLMARLAAAGDGNTYFVQNARDLPDIFRRELGDLTLIAARDLELRIVLPPGVRALRLVGRDGECDGRTVIVRLNQLYGSAERYALVEVEIDPAAPDATREVAAAELAFADPVDGRRAVQRTSLAARFTADERTAEASVSVGVAKDYAANLVAEAREQAIARADAGDRRGAADELRAVNEKLGRVSASVQAAAAPAVAQAATEADQLEREGMDNARRKLYRAESYQTQHQSTRPATP